MIEEMIEGNLKFIFNDWDKIIKFDKHVDYNKVKKFIPNTKGIDYIGIQNGKVYFIEVTDFRTHKIDKEVKSQLKNEGTELMIEVGEKVKNSLACILAGTVNSTHEIEFWNKVTDIIQESKNNIFVILWMEEDNSLPQNYKGKLSSYNSILKQKLSWFSARVQILNRNIENSIGVQVKEI